MGTHAALMVIDVQSAMFLEADPVHNADHLLRNIRSLIERARSSETPIIYIQHNASPGKPLEPGTKGWEIYSDIRPNIDEVVIQKTTPDSFFETNLQQELSARGIKRLVLTGIQTELCVDTTCRRARSLGFDVVVAKDAHSTWKRGNLNAQQIIEHHNSLLSWFAKVEESNKIMF